MPHVYLLRCADGSFYVGSTQNLEARVKAHQSGRGGRYTRSRLPVALVWSEEFARIDDAWVVERRIHGWTRAKKQALVDGEWDALRRLSRTSEP